MHDPKLVIATLAFSWLAVPLSAQNRPPTSRPAQSRSTEKTKSSWEGKLEESTKLFSAGKVPAAMDLAREALATAEAEFAPEDEELVKPLLFLSSLLIMQRQHEEAERHSVRAREITERQLARARQRLATTLKYLGAIYTQRNKLDEAQKVYERAVEISEETVGEDHPETAKHVGNLAALMIKRGKNEAGEALLVRALAIWKKQAAPNPVYTVGDMCNLAELRIRQGQLEAAVALYADAVAIQEKAFGATDPRLRNTLQRYAKALRKAGRTAEADAVEKRASGK